MNVFIIRNAQFETNASMKRIVTALNSVDINCFVIGRNRSFNQKTTEEIKVSEFLKKFEIGIKSKYGKGTLGIFNVFMYQFKVLNILFKQRKNIDILHVIDLDAALPVILFSKIMRKQYIYHIADFYVESRNIKSKLVTKLVKNLEFIVINNAEVTVICTEERIEQIKGSKPKEVKVIHNVPILEQERLVIENSESLPIKYAYVGALNEKRFIEEIIKTFIDQKDKTLYIAGMGDFNDYIEKISKTHNNINFLGTLNYSDALNLYEKSDVMIGMYDPNVKNHKFAAPNKIYESINLAKPIIFTKNIGLSELVEKKDFGWTIDYDIKSFKALVKDLEREEIALKANNAAAIRGNFSWEKIQKDIISLYKKK